MPSPLVALSSEADHLFNSLIVLVMAITIAILVVVLVLRPALARRAVEREADALRPETLLCALGRRPIVLAIDVSGSMYPFRAAQEVWAKAFRNAGATVVRFDHDLHLDDSEPILNLGGTDVSSTVQAYVENLDPHPVVVVLSDGVAPRLAVAHPNLWHWALVADAPPWAAERLPGSTYTIQEVS